MTEVDDIRAKVAECRRLEDRCTDPLSRDVYRAMLAEFSEKLAMINAPMSRAAARAIAESRYRQRP